MLSIMYYCNMPNKEMKKTTMYLPSGLLIKAKRKMLDDDGKVNLSALVKELLKGFCDNEAK